MYMHCIVQCVGQKVITESDDRYIHVHIPTVVKYMQLNHFDTQDPSHCEGREITWSPCIRLAWSIHTHVQCPDKEIGIHEAGESVCLD